MANIELPKDAKGREIPLDTGTLYKENGTAKYIYHYEFDPRDKYWAAETDEGPRNTSEFLLNKPDTLKQLLEDLDRAANAKGFGCCAYADRSERDCTSCIAAGDRACTQPIMRDIAFRIRELVGEDDIDTPVRGGVRQTRRFD